MIIDCIADLHGHYPKLEGGDLLIVAGDLTASDKEIQYKAFYTWLEYQNYRKIIYIGGNHDNYLQHTVMTGLLLHIEYLCDSGTEFEGLKIWGSPWTKRFEGMNPHCMAFTVDTEEKLKAKFDLIPSDVDILITHSPPLGFGDEVDEVTKWGTKQFHVGSSTLHHLLYTAKIRPKLHVFGHIHEGYGHIPKIMDMPGVQMVNASHINEIYDPVNKPIRIEL